MKGNLFGVLRAAWGRALGRLRKYLDARTPHQRVRIVVVAFVLFAVLDVWMLTRIFRGEYDAPCIEHIEALQPLNP